MSRRHPASSRAARRPGLRDRSRPAHGGRTALFLSAGAAIAVTAVAMFPCLFNDFTNWDDDRYVTNNPLFFQPFGEALRYFFTRLYLFNYHPLTMLSYWVEFRFFGNSPLPYHLANYILHLANTGLVYWFFLRLSGKWQMAFGCALLFGVHPTHVESVAWIAERKDVLYSLFFLAAMNAYLRYCRAPSPGSYVVTAVAFVLSLLSKAMAVSFPLVMFLVDFLEGRRLTRRTVLEKAPFLALSAVFAVVALVAQKSHQGARGAYEFDVYTQVLTACHGVVFYLQKSCLPFGLSALYPYGGGNQPRIPTALFQAPALLLTLTGLIVGAFVYGARKSRKIAFGGGFFLATILPVIQLVPVGHAFAADRYLYLPGLGLIYLAVGAVCGQLFGAGGADEKPLVVRRSVAIVAAAGLILGAVSWNRCGIWKNSFTMWNDVLEKFPESYIAHHNRTSAFLDQGDYGRMMADVNLAIQAAPDYAPAYAMRGLAYFRQGKIREALDDFDQCFLRDPTYADVYNSRGLLFLSIGEYRRAVEDQTRAVELQPLFSKAFNDRGVAWTYIAEQETSASLDVTDLDAVPAPLSAAALEAGALAIADFTRALKLGRQTDEVYSNRGIVYGDLMRFEQALADYNSALRANPRSLVSIANRGLIHLKSGRYEDAISDYTAAIAMEPTLAMAYKNRGIARSRTGDEAAAVEDYNRALAISPDFRDVLRWRAKSLVNLRRIDDARKDVERYRELGGVSDEQLLRATGLSSPPGG